MPDTTNIQSLPLIQPSQAQKHVTHNEALKILDLIVQMTVASRTLSEAPPSPVLGACHIVGTAPSGLWAGHEGHVTTFTGIIWEFYPPKVGWTAYVVDEAAAVVFDGAGWGAASEGPAEFTQIGVSATPDATNRLTVSAPATLLNHDGNGHQLKINKAGSTDTASLMFQTGFSGRAEMGTAGSDDFAIKVSADGSAFTEAVAFDRTTGRTVVQQGLRLTPAAGDLGGPVDGEVWYDGTSAKFRARQNGNTVDLI